MSDISDLEWLSLHQYQFDGSHKNRNECGLCSMSMLLNIGFQLTGLDHNITPVLFGKKLDRIPFRHPRIPAWFPGPGGATHPRAALKGMQQKIREIRHLGYSIPLWPVKKTRQKLKHLELELKAGHPALIYGLGKSGIPHVVVPIARLEKRWKILDPGYPSNRNPMIWSDEKLLQWWQGFSGFYPAGTMINLIPQRK